MVKQPNPIFLIPVNSALMSWVSKKTRDMIQETLISKHMSQHMSLSIHRISAKASKYMLTYPVNLNFGLSLQLYPLFVCASSESSGKFVHLNLRCLPIAHLQLHWFRERKKNGYRLPPIAGQFWGNANDCPTKHVIMFVGLRPYFHEY